MVKYKKLDGSNEKYEGYLNFLRYRIIGLQEKFAAKI